MPSQPKSPYASPFKTGVKNGTPPHIIVNTISKRTGKPAASIWQSLFKAGLCFRQKFNGQWIYWPCFTGKKPSVTNCNTCQTTMWQCFVDWCLATGCCTPVKLNNHTGSQKSFMSYCGKFFTKQVAGATLSKPKTKTKKNRKAKKHTKPSMHKTWKPTPSKTKKHTFKKSTSSWTRTGAYKFPTLSKSRRYVKAA